MKVIIVLLLILIVDNFQSSLRNCVIPRGRSKLIAEVGASWFRGMEEKSRARVTFGSRNQENSEDETGVNASSTVRTNRSAKIRWELRIEANNVAARCLKTASIQIFNKAEGGGGGGPGSPAELSPDISCQHFITVAVIKRLSPRLWPRAAKLHLDRRNDPPHWSRGSCCSGGGAQEPEVDQHPVQRRSPTVF